MLQVRTELLITCVSVYNCRVVVNYKSKDRQDNTIYTIYDNAHRRYNNSILRKWLKIRCRVCGNYIRNEKLVLLYKV